MIRIGVLGAGGHSSVNHGPALRRCKEECPEDVELTAICDLDADKGKAYAECFGFEKVYADLDAMVETEDLDGIVAVTPISLTGELAVRIARLGKPLVVEKPPGETLEEARRLRDAVGATGVPHMVSFNRRFSPAFARAREWLAGKSRPELVVARMLRHERREEEFVFGTGIHSVDTVLALMGVPERVVGQVYPVSAKRTPFFDARVTFRDGGAATFLFAPACGRVEESVEIVGDGYDIQVDMGDCGIEIHEGKETVLAWRASDEVEEWERNGALDETRAFIRYLETGEGWWPTLEEAFRSTWTSEAIQRGGKAVLEE